MQAVRFDADAGEAGHAREADQVVGVEQRLLHQHDEGGAAGHRAAVFLVLVQQRQGFVEAWSARGSRSRASLDRAPGVGGTGWPDAFFTESMIW